MERLQSEYLLIYEKVNQLEEYYSKKRFEDIKYEIESVFKGVENIEVNNSNTQFKTLIKELIGLGWDKVKISDYFHNLIFAPNRGFDQLVQKDSKKILFIIEELGYKIDIPTIAGELPILSFNAQAIRTKSGVILTVNTGLFLFIYQISRIYVNSINVMPEDTPRYSEDEAVFLLEQVLNAYILLDNVGMASRLPFSSGVREIYESHFTEGAEVFVLAHEYGHAIARHLSSNGSTKHAIGNGQHTVELIRKSWEEEFEADEIAINILFKYAERSGDNKEDLMSKALFLGGVYIFFHMDDYINGVLNFFQSKNSLENWISDHPSGKYRIKRINEKIFNDDSFSDQFKSWIIELSDKINENFEKWKDPVLKKLIIRKLFNISPNKS